MGVRARRMRIRTHLRHPWRDIFRNRSLLTLALCLLLFQLANASLPPLASERVSVKHGGISELVTSAFVVVPQVVTALLDA
jgi:hypothetical protein